MACLPHRLQECRTAISVRFIPASRSRRNPLRKTDNPFVIAERTQVQPTRPTTDNNRLLATLPDKDFQYFLERCESVDLKFEELLGEPGEPISHVYFPIDGFISLVSVIDGRPSLEVGLVGNEGMLGATLFLGVDTSPFRAVVQGSGTALRLSGEMFCRALERRPALRQQIKLYLYVMMEQFAQTAACTRFHVVEARLARWFLMSQDRAHSSEFHVTHEFLAYMLGVRRVGITKAATSLQYRKLIEYHRGRVKILDRDGLKAASCKCYESDRATYSEVFALHRTE